MKKILYLMALLLLIGCQEEELFKSKQGNVRVTASFADTRTVFTEDGNVAHVNWEKDDAIGICTKTQSNLEYRAQEAGRETEFYNIGERLQAAEGDSVYAYYPASPYFWEENPYYVMLPNIGFQKYGENYADYDFTYAANEVKEGEVNLQFKHLFAYLKITIPTELISDRGDNGGLYIESTEGMGVVNAAFDLQKGEMVLGETYDIQYLIADTVQAQEITCYIAILPQSSEATLKISHYAEYMIKDCLLTKKAPEGGFKAGNIYTLYLNENEEETQRKIEREALIAFYKATGGDNWKRNDNWCSDKPVNEWYGIYCYGAKNAVSSLQLVSNNLCGYIPEEIGNLTNLDMLVLSMNDLSGTIPTSIGKLSNLSYLALAYTNLSGSIPKEIGNLNKLKSLRLFSNKLSGAIPHELGNLSSLESLVLQWNELSGELPAELKNLTNIKTFDIRGNKFSGSLPEYLSLFMDCFTFALNQNNFTGKIPQSITSHPNWALHWPFVISENYGLDLSGVSFPAPEFSVVDLEGNIITSDEYAKNELTVLYHWATWCNYSLALNEQLIELYNIFHHKGLEIIGFSTVCPYSDPCDELTALKNFVQDKNIPWRNFANQQHLMEDGSDPTNTIGKLSTSGGIPSIFIVDKEGKIIFESVTSAYCDAPNFIIQHFGTTDLDLYTSTDYTRDGEVVTLQKATVGKGIDLVFMGEAFVDKDMEPGGKYEQKMEEAMEQYFSIEPYKTFRNRFNVYAVKVVSPNAEFIEGAQHRINESDGICFEYVQKVPGISTDRLHVSVVYNTAGSAGRSYTRMYPDGTFVGYMMEGVNNVLNHEVGGHGFAKLLDEYVEGGNENLTLPDKMKENLDLLWEDLAWGANVDWRNDRATVKWSRLLNDSHYANEGLGLYEGAYLYGHGAYRPTENSMMRYNDSPFNAPSREQIYKCIMQQSEGESWTYDYEKFVEYDAINRNATVTRALQTKPSEAARKEWRQRHRPPVFVKGTWRDAMKKQKRSTVVPLR